MFWMATGVLMVGGSAPLPTLPALDWDPMELAGEGIGERGDGVPVPLRSGRKENWFITQTASGTAVPVTRALRVPAKMPVTSVRSKGRPSPSGCWKFIC